MSEPVLTFPEMIFTAQSIPPLITGMLLLLVGGFILFQERFSLAALSFFVLCVILVVWSIGMAGLYVARTLEVARVWSKLAMASVPIMIPAAFHFMVTMLGSRERWRNLLRAATMLSLLIVGLQIPTNWLVKRIYVYDWGHFPQFGWLGNVMTTYIFMMIFLMMGISWFEYQEMDLDQVDEGRAGGLTTAFGMGCFAFIDLLPGYGFSVYPMGFLALNLFCGMAFYVQVRYGVRPLKYSFMAEDVFRSIEDPLMICDRHGNIRRVNSACESLLETTADRVRGQNIRETLRGVPSVESVIPLSPDDTGGGGREDCELTFQTSSRSFRLSASRLIDEQNQYLGSLVLIKPCSEKTRGSNVIDRDTSQDHRILGTSPA